MGSNLLFPLTKKRTMGWRLFRSGDALPNLLSVWVSLAIILLNLDRFSEAPLIPPLPYLALMVVVPCGLCLAWRAWSDLQALRRSAGSQRQAGPATLAAVEALDETAEADF
jgi:hypothetical protein